MTCLLPNVTHWFTASTDTRRRRRESATDEHQRAALGFDFDGQATYSNLSTVMPESDAIVIYKDPVIDDFTDGWLTVEASSPITIIFTVSILELTAQMHYDEYCKLM